MPLCPHNQRRAISPVCTSLVCISASVCPDPCGCATSMHRARMNFRRFSPAANSLPESRAPHFGSSIMPYSAFSVVRKAVRAMFGRAPGHAWVEPETGDLPRGPPQPKHSSKKISGPGRAVRTSGAAFCRKAPPPAPAKSHPSPCSGPRRNARGWNPRRGIGPGDRRRVRIARKKSRAPGAGCVGMDEFWCQLSSKRYVKFYLESPVSQPEKSPRSRPVCKWWEATFRGIKYEYSV